MATNKDATITFRLHGEDKEHLQQLAEENGLSVSQLICQLIEEFINKGGAK